MQSHVAIFPSPGMGHIIPLLELAKLLVTTNRVFSVTFIIPTNDADPGMQSAQKSLFTDSLPKNIKSIFLPPVNLSDLPDDTRIESRISLCVNRSLPALHGALKALSENGYVMSALLVDILGVCAIDFVKEHNIPPYVFFFSNAMVLSLVLNLSKLDETVTCEYGDLTEPVRLPGCIPLNGKDLPDIFQDKANAAYKFSLEKCKMYHSAEGIIVNSFLELEPDAFKANQFCKVPIYPIGPLTQTSNAKSSSPCLKWLDQQPSGSVLYICFGSGGTLSSQQLIELAFGLEMSEQRFLWIMKSPSEESNSAAFFSVERTSSDPLSFLPRGFLERTKTRGFVTSSWAPQTQVMSHSATCGFLTHCGWNSILDAIVNGVPLIAWPLFAEQKMLAALVAQGLGVALRVQPNGKGIVERKKITNIINELMGGEQGRSVENRMRVLKDAAAMVHKDGGSSHKALEDLVFKWTQMHKKCWISPC